MDRLASWALAALLAGCGGCEETTSLQVTEPFPHTRCLALDPPPDRAWHVGGLALSMRDRELTIAGAAEPIRIAAFTGPAFGPPASAQDVAALAERKPTFAVMLGGLGDDDVTASETLSAFEGAEFPMLFVAGGRDDHRRVRAVLKQQDGAARDRVIDLSGLRRVRIGDHELVPIPGASDGRYALSVNHCGFGLADLQALASQLPTRVEGVRLLLAWQAPGRGGPLAVARSPAGLDLGSDALAEFAERMAAPGGIFAWPTLSIAQPSADDGKRRVGPGQPAPDLRVTVPRLTGPPLVVDDGTRVSHGFVMLALDAQGLRMLGRVAVSDDEAATARAAP